MVGAGFLTHIRVKVLEFADQRQQRKGAEDRTINPLIHKIIVRFLLRTPSCTIVSQYGR